MSDDSTRTENASDQGAFAFLPDVVPQKLRRIIEGNEFRVTSVHARRVRGVRDWNASFLVGLHREVFGPFFRTHRGYSDAPKPFSVAERVRDPST